MSFAVADSSTLAGATEIREYAESKVVEEYLDDVVNLARQAFPKSALYLSVGEDAESEDHRYIAIDVDSAGLSTEELLLGQRLWSSNLGRVCPSAKAIQFVLSWR